MMTDSLIFLSEPLEIADENKITILRYNDDLETPFNHINRTLWNYDAKAVKSTTNLGVYGFTPEQARLGRCNYFFGAFSDSILLRRPIKFIQLEVDKNNVFYSDDMEMVFTQANIIKVLSLSELKILFPLYSTLFNLYGQILEAHFPEDELLTEIETAINSARRLGSVIPPIGSMFEPVHGIAHGIRVERNGYTLCQMMGIDNRVIRPFAYMHDFCRENDGTDPCHGPRAANHIEQHREFVKYHFSLNEMEVDLLKFACENHTNQLRSDFEIVNACFDADRLDLPRTGTLLDPKLMATSIGGLYAVSMENN